jgi:hypothetical protein
MRQEWQGTSVGERMLQIRKLHGQLKNQSAPAKREILAKIDGLVSELNAENVVGSYEPISGKFVEETGFVSKRS